MKAASNSDTEPPGDYQVGYGKPTRHTGFQKGRSGNPVMVTEDGRRRRITKPELVIKQLVNKSASADRRAIKQLTDIVQGVERRAGVTPAPSPLGLTAADEEVIAELAEQARTQTPRPAPLSMLLPIVRRR